MGTIAKRAVASALLAAACGVSVPPSGGPEDKTPPSVEATLPARDSTGVDPSTPIEISFSEDMTQTRAERLVTVQPPIEIDRVRWRGRTLVVTPAGGLRSDTTYVVALKPGYRDEHGVAAAKEFEFAFATGATLDTARIEGTVRFRRQPSPSAVVRCFRLPLAEGFVPEASRPDRETPTRRDGTYALRYLPAEGRFLVLAFVDKNGNAAFDREQEPYALYPDTVALSADSVVASGRDVSIIDPDEPAVVRGEIRNETAIDTVAVAVGLYAVADTARAAYYVVCDTAGRYEFAKVRAGDYLLRAFIDLEADSVCGTYDCGAPDGKPCAEPCVTVADTLAVKPGEKLEVPAAVLRRREGR